MVTTPWQTIMSAAQIVYKNQNVELWCKDSESAPLSLGAGQQWAEGWETEEMETKTKARGMIESCCPLLSQKPPGNF